MAKVMQPASMSFGLVWYETTILKEKKFSWNLYFLSTLALVTLSTIISSWLYCNIMYIRYRGKNHST